MKEFGPRAEDFLKVYHGDDDVEALRAANDFGGDNFLVYSTWAWLEAQVKTGGSPVYRYLFALPSPEILFILSLPERSTPMRSNMSSATWTRARARRSGRRTTRFPS